MTERRGTSETAVLTADVCIVVSRVAHTLFLLVVMVVVVVVVWADVVQQFIHNYACMHADLTYVVVVTDSNAGCERTLKAGSPCPFVLRSSLR